MKSGIYYILNIGANKIYVGSSSDVNKRKNEHFTTLRNNKHPNSYLQQAYNKYGEDKFIFGILQIIDVELLIEKEQHWMDYFQSHNPKYGYNIVPFADRHALSEETKAKMSAAKKGVAPHPMTNEGKVKNGEKTKLRWQNGGYKLAVLKRTGLVPWNKGKSATEQAKTNQSKSHLGNKASDETKEKMRQSQIKAWEKRKQNKNNNI